MSNTNCYFYVCRRHAFGEVQSICEISDDVLVSIKWFVITDNQVDMQLVLEGVTSVTVQYCNRGEQMWTYLSSIMLARHVLTPIAGRRKFILTVMA